MVEQARAVYATGLARTVALIEGDPALSAPERQALLIILDEGARAVNTRLEELAAWLAADPHRVLCRLPEPKDENEP